MQPTRQFPAWGDKEISRFKFRVELFKRRGIAPDYADELADRCFERDHEHDPRHLCVECSNFQRGGTCFAIANGHLVPGTHRSAPQVIRDLFINCPAFQWQTPQ